MNTKGPVIKAGKSKSRDAQFRGELRKAAEDYFGEEIDLGGSGRTDSGVHALAQVAHLRAVRKRPPDQLQYALNERLPADIHVLKVEPHAERFHARHSALSRYYLYQISRRRTALAKDYVWWVKGDLNVKRMEECTRLFFGKHDFRNFTEKPGEQGSTLVVVEDFQLKEVGDIILVRLGASHFLWKMVRRLVGVLVQAGLGSLEIKQVRELQSKLSAEVGQWTAPAAGLFLERVIYPGESPPQQLNPAVPVSTLDNQPEASALTC